MTTPADGGPAFPRAAFYESSEGIGSGGSRGMSLRAWFAGQALSGQAEHVPEMGSGGRRNSIEAATRNAVSLADALIQRLQQEDER